MVTLRTVPMKKIAEPKYNRSVVTQAQCLGAVFGSRENMFKSESRIQSLLSANNVLLLTS